ncbi:hypothetical protein [Pseudomonas koreensis]|uniref:hypothetical protein n=1 Tax=Pseudomonas koreensis TaxID=198620 RepID=UPI003F87C8F4
MNGKILKGLSFYRDEGFVEVGDRSILKNKSVTFNPDAALMRYAGTYIPTTGQYDFFKVFYGQLR